MMTYYSSFEDAFADWQDGPQITTYTSLEGERYMVTQTDKGLNVYRAFKIGPNIALSVDLEGGDLAAALQIAFEA